jgi:hypothetical protein
LRLSATIGNRATAGEFVVDEEHLAGANYEGMPDEYDAVTVYRVVEGKIARVMFLLRPEVACSVGKRLVPPGTAGTRVRRSPAPNHEARTGLDPVGRTEPKGGATAQIVGLMMHPCSTVAYRMGKWGSGIVDDDRTVQTA